MDFMRWKRSLGFSQYPIFVTFINSELDGKLDESIKGKDIKRSRVQHIEQIMQIAIVSTMYVYYNASYQPLCTYSMELIDVVQTATHTMTVYKQYNHSSPGNRIQILMETRLVAEGLVAETPDPFVHTGMS